jgi:hypothetical protein
MTTPKSAEVLSVRKEVVDFVTAAETILSPVLLSPELTSGECDLIAEYVKSLSQVKTPWSKALPVKYTYIYGHSHRLFEGWKWDQTLRSLLRIGRTGRMLPKETSL